MPRVGILVECGPDGLEVHVCRKICALLQRDTGVEIEAEIVSMNHKRGLLEGCGATTQILLDSGCERVVILWDEKPAWPDRRERLCWHRDRTRILEELEQANLSHRPIYLVCIEREFESWLLHDHHLLSHLLSTAAHPVRVGKQRHPDKDRDPKGRLTTLFQQHGRTYVDTVWAPRIAAALNSLSRFKKCGTFRRFAERVVGRGY